MLNKGGRVVVIGSRGTVEINPRDLMAKEACVMGLALGLASSAELIQTHAALNTSAQSDFIAPVIAKRFELIDTAAAHIAVMEAGATGNIVINVQ